MVGETKEGANAAAGLTVLASQRIAAHPELYKLVDMCNRTLRDRGVLFGLSKKGDQMTLTIYEAE